VALGKTTLGFRALRSTQVREQVATHIFAQASRDINHEEVPEKEEAEDGR
jgi:hypothetical protein